MSVQRRSRPKIPTKHPMLTFDVWYSLITNAADSFWSVLSDLSLKAHVEVHKGEAHNLLSLLTT